MELASFMAIIKELELISDNEYDQIRSMIVEVGNKINALYRSRSLGNKTKTSRKTNS
jgi:hypothetical protein